MRLGYLQCDRPALPRVGSEPRRLHQVDARRLAPGARLRTRRLTQHFDSLRRHGSWRAAEERVGRSRSGTRTKSPTCADHASGCFRMAPQLPVLLAARGGEVVSVAEVLVGQ